MDDRRDALIGEALESIIAAARPLAAERQHPFGELTITPTQMHVLFVLAHQLHRATVGELARLLGVTPAAVTQLVDTLRSRGLVERRENPEDARSTFVVLTDAAASSIVQFEEAAIARSRWRFDDLDDTELRTLADLLMRLR